MVELTQHRLAEMAAQNVALETAHSNAARDALLEHARMGRSVSEWQDGQIVTIPPEEIFARYGLDANGKPIEGGQKFH